MIARTLEAAGLSTVQLSMVREHTEKLKPPRALFVPFPFGCPVGRADDPQFQHRVVAAALALFERTAGPVLEDFPDDGGLAPDPNPVNRKGESARDRDVAFEVATLRPYYQQYVADRGRTSVGLAKVPATRFRGLVRMLERYASGSAVEPVVHVDGVGVNQYVRWACDDLKAFYVEARLAQHPNARGPEVMSWFWEETLAGDLVRHVRDQMESSGLPEDKAMAYGVARG